MTARQKVFAALLLAPSAVALIVYLILQIGDALGNRSLGNTDLVGGTLVASLILQPLAAVIAIGWAIASWANHGRVPPWLLWAAIGNGLVFYMLYNWTH